MTRGTLKIWSAIWAAMMFRLSPLVSEAKPSADSMPAWRSTSSSIPLPSTISPAKSLPSRSNAFRLLSMTVTWWPALERARAAMAPTRPQPTMTSFMKGSSILGPSGREPAERPRPGAARPEAHCRRSQVDDRERRLWVAIARLPDAPRVDQRRRRQLDPASSLGDLLALLGENSGEVRVPEEAEAAPELHQDLERLEVVKDVFPEVRLARATVHVAVRAQPPVLG